MYFLNNMIPDHAGSKNTLNQHRLLGTIGFVGKQHMAKPTGLVKEVHIDQLLGFDI